MLASALHQFSTVSGAGYPQVVPKKKTKEIPAEQPEDFKRLAREIGADADKDADEVMRRLAKQKRDGGGRIAPRRRPGSTKSG